MPCRHCHQWQASIHYLVGKINVFSLILAHVYMFVFHLFTLIIFIMVLGGVCVGRVKLILKGNSI